MVNDSQTQEQDLNSDFNGVSTLISGKTFLYFAFGSNLLEKRIHINNPSAVFRSIAKLKDYKLGFNYFSQV